MNNDQEGNAGEPNNANSPPRQQQPRMVPPGSGGGVSGPGGGPTNKPSTPPRYPPSAPQQHPMQLYPPSYYPPYQHPTGSPAPAAMYQPQQYGASPSSSGTAGGGHGGNPQHYGYMPQQQQPYPPHGPGPAQGGSPPSQSSMGGTPIHSPSNPMGQQAPPGYPPPAGGGPANAGGPGDQLPHPQHGHPPPQHYSYYHHQQQQQPWNYGSGPPSSYSGMSPGQPLHSYSVYGGGPGGGGHAPHDGMPPPHPQPYGYNATWHQQPPPPPPPPPQYYQGWNGTPQHQQMPQHQQQPHHLGTSTPQEQSLPPTVTTADGGKSDGSSPSGNPSDVSAENKGDSANQPQQQHQQLSAAKQRRPISQEMLKSVQSPTGTGSVVMLPKSPSEIQSTQREEIETMGCTCKKTNCLKLYCQCFAIKIYCGNNCRCSDCFNLPNYEGRRQDAMATITSRNPVAFTAKYKKDKVVDMPAHRLGCKCRKSACLKKYCECFAGGINCSKACRCVGCKNVDGRAAQQMQALERAQLVERQRQKSQQHLQKGMAPPPPSRGPPPPLGHSQPLQPYYPAPPPQPQYPSPMQSIQYAPPPLQHQYPPQPPPLQHQYPPPQQLPPQYPTQPPPPPHQQHQYAYPPSHHGHPPPPPHQHPNMPNYHYGPPPPLDAYQQHQMPVHADPSGPPTQQSPDQQHGAHTSETSWDAAQSLTFLKRSSPGTSPPDAESNDLRMAAAMALTGFGQSPSAPPSSNSLLTPIRPQEQDDEPGSANVDAAGAKRSIHFDDDDRGYAKRQHTEDYNARGDENYRYGTGVYDSPDQTSTMHRHEPVGRNGDRGAEGHDSAGEGLVATEVAYV